FHGSTRRACCARFQLILYFVLGLESFAELHSLHSSSEELEKMKSQVVLLCLLINIKLSAQRGTGGCRIGMFVAGN
ncbi:hypothetical protein V5799_002590, partial [Amblyomma americanum]